MRTPWSALYLQLVSHCNRRSSEVAYGRIRHRQAELMPLGSIAALLHHQQAPGGDPARRNAVLRALIVEAQTAGYVADLASTVVILALWPGLDAVHGRLCRDFPEARGDHGGDILSYMAITIRKLDLAAVNWIAATLVRNVERDLRRRLVTHRKRGRLDLSIDTPTGLAVLEGAMPADKSLPVAAWNARLTEILGRDAALFLRIIVLGETQHQAGDALGLSHDVARKRHQRGMAKLKAAANNLV